MWQQGALRFAPAYPKASAAAVGSLIMCNTLSFASLAAASVACKAKRKVTQLEVHEQLTMTQAPA